eukprot:TRINITY_DN1284_c1_g1_i3.p3 TRINITY_DN1284_c1_g1~~TRINITY_DN1284_c1_g1_i3.p3  ORF type:complete len:115 (+),score=1.77 TRINITY_DN1284_c1_g1_i3:147-491(+)
MFTPQKQSYCCSLKDSCSQSGNLSLILLLSKECLSLDPTFLLRFLKRKRCLFIILKELEQSFIFCFFVVFLRLTTFFNHFASNGQDVPQTVFGWLKANNIIQYILILDKDSDTT